ncbi:MAG: ABC transporter permease subunit [Lysobacteraceae bacterium]
MTDAAEAAGRTRRSVALRHFFVRLLEAAATLWLLLTLCFFLLRAAPGGPFDQEKAAPPAVIEQLNEQYRLDQPLWQQYLGYLGDLARGDLGPSFQYPDYRVSELIAQALPVSLLTGSLALSLSLLLGVPLGVMAALRRGRWPDRLLMFFAGLGLALPKYVVAPLLVLLFAVTLQWLPAGGWNDWRNLVLPVIALSLPNLAYAARLTRASLLEVLGQDYLRAARARGFSEVRVLFRHALRPALLPVLAWLSPALINVVTGSIVVEQIFGIPGIGRYFVQGALNRDYTLVMGVVLVLGVAIVVINALVDWLREIADPRLRDA